MINYETDRLILRNFHPNDVSDYHEYMSQESTALHGINDGNLFSGLSKLSDTTTTILR